MGHVTVAHADTLSPLRAFRLLKGAKLSLVVLCPTRGRPQVVPEVLASFDATKGLADTELIFVIDTDDPSYYDYYNVPNVRVIEVSKDEGGNMVKALNVAASHLIGDTDATILGFIGDDHRFRTNNWDGLIAEAAGNGGIVYANDLSQGANLPTQVFISKNIVSALGYFGLPTCKHLYIDNAWKTLGEGAGCLVYLPDVIIEHMHPYFGKGEWDEGHKRVNSQEMYSEDGAAYAKWLHDQAPADIMAVKAARL